MRCTITSTSILALAIACFNNLTAMVNEPRIWGVELGVKF